MNEKHNVTSSNYSKNINKNPWFKAPGIIWLQKEWAVAQVVACAGPQTASVNNFRATRNTIPAGLSSVHFLNFFFCFFRLLRVSDGFHR